MPVTTPKREDSNTLMQVWENLDAYLAGIGVLANAILFTAIMCMLLIDAR